MTIEVDRAVDEVLKARVRPPGPAAPVAPASTESSAQSMPSVLLVMDDVFFRKLLRRQLEEAGYVVAESLSVDRAMQRVRSDEPDLVILDTWVDRGTGLGVLEALRADSDRQDTPVLLVGSDSRAEVRRRAAELGALGPVPINRAMGVELWVEAALFAG
jgi:CheY-like chemotaxis protein